jgi:hypothetical protein
MEIGTAGVDANDLYQIAGGMTTVIAAIAIVTFNPQSAGGAINQYIYRTWKMHGAAV